MNRKIVEAVVINEKITRKELKPMFMSNEVVSIGDKDICNMVVIVPNE